MVVYINIVKKEDSTVYQKASLGGLYDESYLEDLEEELMEFEGITNKVKSLIKPNKSSKKFKNKVVFE